MSVRRCFATTYNSCSWFSNPSFNPAFPRISLRSHNLTQCRHETTARRTTKRLRTKPDPSLIAAIPESNLHDHIVFNPPSSAPSPYHTPPAFLPAHDPRRKLLSQSHHTYNPYADPTVHLPPPAQKIKPEKKYHLGPKEIAAIRRLRLRDPKKWTRGELAKQFHCSTFFVSMIVEAPREKKAMDQEKLDEVKRKWGKRRTYAREDREKRKALWAMDR